MKALGLPGDFGRNATDRVAVAHKFVRENVMDKTVMGTALRLEFATLQFVLKHQTHQVVLSNLLAMGFVVLLKTRESKAWQGLI